MWNLFPFSPFFIQSSNQLFWLLLCAAALFALFHLIFFSLRYTRFVRLLLSFAAFACCYCALLANMPTFVLPLISSPKCITMNAPCGAPWTCAHRSYSIATTAFKKNIVNYVDLMAFCLGHGRLSHRFTFYINNNNNKKKNSTTTLTIATDSAQTSSTFAFKYYSIYYYVSSSVFLTFLFCFLTLEVLYIY